jgi:heme/copper-type cytochrome/quinol oxidase subunit 3
VEDFPDVDAYLEASEQWPQDELPLPSLLLPMIAVVALIVGSTSQWLAGRFFRGGSLSQTHAALAVTFITGLTFLGVQGYILAETFFRWDENAYASFFHVMNWMTAAFVAVGIAMNLAAHVRLARDGNDARSFSPLQMQLTSMYWHFAVVVAIAVFATVYLSPNVL